MDNTILHQTQPLDYVNSENAAEIDNGIRDTIKGIRLSILAMGIGLAKIKSMSLFTDLNCRHMTEYVERLCDDTKMERSSIFNWLSIGEAYIKYRSELELIGFSEVDGPTKLPFLDRALAAKQKDEVFNNIKSMSLREFISFAKSEPINPDDNPPLVSIRGSTVYVNGKVAVILSKSPDEKYTKYFKKVINAACEALEAGEVILPVRLRNMREARRFGPVIEQLKMKMRIRESV
jgi:hypothetical protein